MSELDPLIEAARKISEAHKKARAERPIGATLYPSMVPTPATEEKKEERLDEGNVRVKKIGKGGSKVEMSDPHGGKLVIMAGDETIVIKLNGEMYAATDADEIKAIRALFK